MHSLTVFFRISILILSLCLASCTGLDGVEGIGRLANPPSTPGAGLSGDGQGISGLAPPPQIQEVYPFTRGAVNAGTTLQITGNTFESGLQVSANGVPCSVVAVFPQQVTCTLTTAAPDLFPIVVTNRGGGAASYTPPSIAQYSINNTAATAALSGSQRSMVDSISITFTQQVTLGQGAISLALQPNATLNGVAIPSGIGTIPTLTVSTGDNTTYDVTFSGAGVVNASLADGVYVLKIDHTLVQGSESQPMSADQTYTFWRLFGDFNGNATVDPADQTTFNNSFNTSYAPADYSGANAISNLDKLQFNKRFGWTLSF